MKIKHNPLEIPEDNPFANCKLERGHYATVLTNIVELYSDGFVLAINNEWGSGKTTFVKMWQQHLTNKAFQTIYFNAWENDFDSNPMVALMSELESLKTETNKDVFKSVISKGAVLIKHIAPAIAKSLIKRYVMDVDDFAIDAAENATKASTEILEEEIKEYISKKKNIIEFRKELEKYVKQAENSKALIFIVDELDRCRPNYSVELLEQIKHLFSVKGIVFVLSIDKKHLGSAIKGFYGSEEIDCDEYLRRFIDLEYSMPIPQTKLFNEYLFGYYQFNDFFSSDERSSFPEFREDGQLLLKIADALFTKTSVTLRQQERVFALTRLILCSFKSNQYTFSHLLFILVYLKTMRSEVFQKIEKNEFSLQELSDLFFGIIYSEKKDTNGINLLYIESLLLWFYNNDRDYHVKEKLLDKDESNNLISPIKSRFESTRISLAQCFEHIRQHFNYEDIGLNYLNKKINLTEAVTIQ